MKLIDWLAKESVSDRNFAASIGVSKQSVHRYKLGHRFPHPSILVRISSATDGQVTANDFLTGEPAEAQ